MSNPIFYILDVFAEQKYSGNQLAVVRNCGDFTTEKMQKMALEMNYSETTFILSDSPRDGGYDVRIFTPGTELPFAGHPTLGTSFIIQQMLVKEPVENIKLNLKVGQIPVTFIYKDSQPDILWMKQNQPEFGVEIDPRVMAEVLNITIDDWDSRFPILEVSTGSYVAIVPLKTLSAVKKARLNIEKYTEFIRRYQLLPIYLFSPETYSRENNLNCRFFAECFGITEDPATGSAAGCLTGYLCKYKYFGSEKIDITVEQGYEINRPSRLYLRGNIIGKKIDIYVGGKVHLVAVGEIL